MRFTSLGLAAIVGCANNVPPKLTVEPVVQHGLSWGYGTVTARAGLENAWCLYGTKSRKNVTVTRAEYPAVHESTPHSISFGCRPSKDYLGTAHSHNANFPGNLPCNPSQRDYQGFVEDKKSVLMGVICGETSSYTLKK